MKEMKQRTKRWRECCDEYQKYGGNFNGDYEIGGRNFIGGREFQIGGGNVFGKYQIGGDNVIGKYKKVEGTSFGNIR